MWPVVAGMASSKAGNHISRVRVRIQAGTTGSYVPPHHVGFRDPAGTMVTSVALHQVPGLVGGIPGIVICDSCRAGTVVGCKAGIVAGCTVGIVAGTVADNMVGYVVDTVVGCMVGIAVGCCCRVNLLPGEHMRHLKYAE